MKIRVTETLDPMSFFAILISLLIEQIKPLSRARPIDGLLSRWMNWVGRNFNAGRDHHAWVVWLITVLSPALLVAVVSMSLSGMNVLLSLVWDVIILYLTLGFRQFSHFFTDIRDSLERGDDLSARRYFSEWRYLDVSDLPRNELLRHVIEYSLLSAHRHVFGVFFAFLLLSGLGLGPAGAVLYRLAEFTSRYWDVKAQSAIDPTLDRIKALSQQLFELMDYLPVRFTAFGFAIVGNFEEAINSWRRDASLWKHSNEGVLLASASGAVGVRLGGSAPEVQDVQYSLGDVSPEIEAEGSTAGAVPTIGHLRGVVGLVWRSVVFWMLLLALLSVANLLG